MLEITHNTEIKCVVGLLDQILVPIKYSNVNSKHLETFALKPHHIMLSSSSQEIAYLVLLRFNNYNNAYVVTEYTKNAPRRGILPRIRRFNNLGKSISNDLFRGTLAEGIFVSETFYPHNISFMGGKKIKMKLNEQFTKIKETRLPFIELKTLYTYQDLSSMPKLMKNTDFNMITFVDANNTVGHFFNYMMKDTEIYGKSITMSTTLTKTNANTNTNLELEHSSLVNSVDEKRKSFWMFMSSIPDVYFLSQYQEGTRVKSDDSVHLAIIPSIEVSNNCRQWVNQTNPCKVECKKCKETGRWIPLNKINCGR